VGEGVAELVATAIGELLVTLGELIDELQFEPEPDQPGPVDPIDAGLGGGASSGDAGFGGAGSGDAGFGGAGSGDAGFGGASSGDAGSADPGVGDYPGFGDLGSGDAGFGDAGSGDVGEGD
jgi:PPE-repeat protein